MSSQPNVLVIDDSNSFVDALVREFDLNGVSATGCSDPAQVLTWRSRDRFAYDLVLLDMQLGEAAENTVLSALNVLPHIKTYAPSSAVIVFSDKHMTVEQALKCVQLGALTVMPKGTEAAELCRVAEIYQQLGNPQEARQELIEVLWQDMTDGGADERSGQRLEMLVMNLFESMPTFRVVDNNHDTGAGSTDVLVESLNKQRFWEQLSSLHLAIECKNQTRPPEPRDVNQLTEVVKWLRFSNVGIFVSMGGFSSSFRRRQDEVRRSDGVHIFGLDADDMQRLVEMPFDRREDYLRRTLESQ